MKAGDRFYIEGSKLFITSGTERGRTRAIESYDASTGTVVLKVSWIERVKEASTWLINQARAFLVFLREVMTRRT